MGHGGTGVNGSNGERTSEVSHPFDKKKSKGWGTGVNRTNGERSSEVSHPFDKKKSKGWGTAVFC